LPAGAAFIYPGVLCSTRSTRQGWLNLTIDCVQGTKWRYGLKLGPAAPGAPAAPGGRRPDRLESRERRRGPRAGQKGADGRSERV